MIRIYNMHAISLVVLSCFWVGVFLYTSKDIYVALSFFSLYWADMVGGLWEDIPEEEFNIDDDDMGGAV